MNKYIPGRRIESLDTLMRQTFVVYVNHGHTKTYHRGWFGSWQLRYVQEFIDRGVLFEAQPNPDCNLDKKTSFWEAVHGN